MFRNALPALFVLSSVCAPAFAQDFLGKSAAEWVNQLNLSADAKLRRSAAFAIGKMGGRGVKSLPALKAAFAKEKDAGVKDAIVFAMAELCRDTFNAKSDPDLEALFIRAAGDADAHIRRSGAHGLGCLGKPTPEARRALQAALEDKEAIVRQSAAWATPQFGLEAPAMLKRALSDSDALVKRDAATALRYLGSDDAEHNEKALAKVRELLKDLLPLCRDANSEVRRAALNVLILIVDPKDKDAIPPLAAAMEDTDPENRINAALALSNIGGEETAKALPVLLEAIKGSDEEVRRQAALAIRNIGPAAKNAVPDLITVLRDDRDPRMREYAALALGSIGADSEPAVPLLLRRVQDGAEDIEVRIKSATALAKIGPVPAATRIAPDLLAVLGDPRQDARVRERVMWSLRVHAEELRKMKGPKEVFTRILTERLPKEHRMLRYDCAYMLGMIWGREAPKETLDVLAEFLGDDTIKVYGGTVSGVGGAGAEVKAGNTNVKDQGVGDGRIMATEALERIGAPRYSQRPDIMKRLRSLAVDRTTYEPLRKMAAALVKGL